MSSRKPVFLPTLRRDIQDVVMWSEERFGVAAADRYAALISQALRDIYAEPTRPGARPRHDLAPGAYTYHLMLSRDRIPGPIVRRPRHFILYRILSNGTVEIARLLHDASDLPRHLPYAYVAEESDDL